MKKEAVALIAAIVVVLQLAASFIDTGSTDWNALVAALNVLFVAGGAFFARKQVYSQDTVNQIIKGELAD